MKKKPYTIKDIRQWLAIEDIAWLLSVRVCTVRKMIESGQMPRPLDLGGMHRWHPEEIDTFFRKQCRKHDVVHKALRVNHGDAPPEIPAELATIGGQRLNEYAGFRLGPCVYFLILDDRVVYVGKTTNLPARVHSHAKGSRAKRRQSVPKKEFNRVLFLPVDRDDLDEAEVYFIKELEPVLNKTGFKPKDEDSIR